MRELVVVFLAFVEGGAKLSVNGESRGAIPGEVFNRALTRIRLGDKPVQADLKKPMLGG